MLLNEKTSKFVEVVKDFISRNYIRLSIILLFSIFWIYFFLIFDNILKFPEFIFMNFIFVVLFIFLPQNIFILLALELFLIGFSVFRESSHAIISSFQPEFLFALIFISVFSVLFSFLIFSFFKYYDADFRKDKEKITEDKRIYEEVKVSDEINLEALKRRVDILFEEIESEIKSKYDAILKRKGEIIRMFGEGKSKLQEYYSLLMKIYSGFLNETRRVQILGNLVSDFVKNLNTSASYMIGFSTQLSGFVGGLSSFKFSGTTATFFDASKTTDHITDTFGEKISSLIQSISYVNLYNLWENIYRIREHFYVLRKLMQDFLRIPHICYGISIKISQVAASSGDSDVRRRLSAIVQDIDGFSFRISVNIAHISKRISDFDGKISSLSDALDIGLRSFSDVLFSLSDIRSRYFKGIKSRVKFFMEQYEKISDVKNIMLELDKDLEALCSDLSYVVLTTEDLIKKTSSFISSPEFVSFLKDLEDNIQNSSLLVSNMDQLIGGILSRLEALNSLGVPENLMYTYVLKSVHKSEIVKKLLAEISS
jgi:hypothetical protein